MTRSTSFKAWMLFTRSAIAMATVVVFAPSSAQAWDDDRHGGPVTHPTMCGQVVTGNVVLNQDIICYDTGAGASGLLVGGPNTTIQFRGFSIKCSSAVGFKFSCQGDYYSTGYADTGIDTCGFSNVSIKGPGLIQGFTVGVRMRGMPPPDNTGPCGVGPAWPKPANNVKTQKLNVTAPDGRQDISEPLAGPRPASFGIDVTDFVENAWTCSWWDRDDGHTHGVEVFGNAVDNHVEGIALYNSSRVNVHENFAHDNNNAGDTAPTSPICTTDIFGVMTCVSTAPITVENDYESHGIVVCGDGQPLCHGTSVRNHIHNNLIVNNGQNAHCNDANMDSNQIHCTTNNGPNTGNNDGGLTLTGDVRKNLVHENTVIGNNGDGISIRNGAQLNKIIDNSSAYNSSTDADGTPYQMVDPNYSHTMFFWDVAFRNAGSSNYVQPSSNRCLTQSPSVPGGVCAPNENTTWFQTP